MPLTVIDSPYREITRPIIDFVKSLRRDSPRDVVTVFIPEYVVGRWWEHLLHNQSALRLKGRLLFEPGVMVTSVPWQLASSSTKDLDRLRPGAHPAPAARAARGAAATAGRAWRRSAATPARRGTGEPRAGPGAPGADES